MVSVLLLGTGFVVTGKETVVAFAATVTLAGGVAMLVLLLVRVMRVPPAGARPLKVTVPVDEFPPVTEVGLSESELRAGGLIFKVAFLVAAL